jgi:hypothetical protein
MPPPAKGWRDSLSDLYHSHVKGGKLQSIGLCPSLQLQLDSIVDACATHSCRSLSAGFAVLPLSV